MGNRDGREGLLHLTDSKKDATIRKKDSALDKRYPSLCKKDLVMDKNYPASGKKILPKRPKDPTLGEKDPSMGIHHAFCTMRWVPRRAGDPHQRQTPLWLPTGTHPG